MCLFGVRDVETRRGFRGSGIVEEGGLVHETGIFERRRRRRRRIVAVVIHNNRTR